VRQRLVMNEKVLEGINVETCHRDLKVVESGCGSRTYSP